MSANKTYDTLGAVASSVAVTTTASSTGANIVGLNIGDSEHVAVITNGAVTGTVDGSNYYSTQLEVSDAVGGTYYAVGNPVKFGAVAKVSQVGFTSQQIRDMVAGAAFFRLTTTKTGTTATAVTVSAFISKI